MLQEWMRFSWTVAVVVGGAIASTSQCVFAQSVTLDGTLGSARTLNGPRYTIQQTDGQTVGNNLFHSFGRFNLTNVETATFQSGANIQNIISRVTGGSRSTIDGLISTESRSVNLFLINPSGIVFGQNARLNVGGTTRGSFVATTLDGLVWANGGQFSATNPGGPSSLLTLVGDPSGFLSSLRPPQPISASGSNLFVPEGQSLLLLGGNLTLDKTQLTAPGGQIELAGVSGAGTVELGINGNILKLNIPDSIARGDISFNNGTTVDVTGANGGSINVTGHNVDILGGSQIQAGIAARMGTANSQAGDININGTGTFTLNPGSSIGNIVPDGAQGNTGNINIQAGDIFITSITNPNNTHSLETANGTAPGRTGNVSLKANGNITVKGQNRLVGNDGKTINDGNVISTFGTNTRTGDISLNAGGAISLDDTFFITSNFGGDAGNILLEANKSISLANNSSLVSTAFGRGNSGNITVQSSSGLVSLQTSLVSTAVGSPGATRTNPNLENAGNITISGKSISINGGTEISSRTFSGVNSGNIDITGTEQVEISGRAPIIPRPGSSRANSYIYTTLATTSEIGSRGLPGNVSISTKNLRISNGAILRTESNSNARGGNIDINGNTFELTSGGQLITTASRKGDAGDVNLNVKDSVFISGVDPDRVTVFNLIGRRRAQNFPDLSPDRSSASGIFANTSGNSTAKGGDINITTGQLRVEKGGSVTVSSLSGQAGNLTITAKDIRLNSGNLTAETAITRSAPGANINLNGLDLLLLQNESLISAKANRNATGGNITIDARNGVVVAPLLENNDIIASAVGGQGGNITINSRRIFGLTQGTAFAGNRTNDVDVSSQFNTSGIVTFNTFDIDPSLGLIDLPTVVVDASKLVDTSCIAGSQTKFSELTVTGRGGLPPSPYDPLTSDATWSDTRLPNIVSVQKLSESQRLSNRRVPLETKDHIAIVPATGWVFNNKGEVTLIANSSGNVPSNTSSCPKR